ncbi:MAG: hypothetical protein GU356_01270 [Pyrobaculum sp.]|jgi:hypothetical protein|nr:hypothetical protein [Pyrobaculum sp.]
MDVIPAVVFFFLLIAASLLVFSYISPLLASAERTEPAWQMVETGNVINFRQAAYFASVRVEAVTNCSSEIRRFRVWYVLPSPPGELRGFRGGTLSAAFEGGQAEPVGSWAAAVQLYKVRYVTATFTNITNVAEVVYGGPLKIEVIDVREITIPPPAGFRACSFCIRITGTQQCIYSDGGVFIKIYNRTAVVR